MDEDAAHDISGAESGSGGVVESPNRREQLLQAEDVQRQWKEEQKLRRFAAMEGPVPPAPYPNTFSVGEVGFTAWEDRMIIEEDEFRSGYECPTCDKRGVIVCPSCGGTGHSAVVKEAKCSLCNMTGEVSCPTCQGKGEFLVVPQQSERRPTTGTIVSTGPKVRELQRGERVLYADYTGQLLELPQDGKRPVVLRILRECEILCKLSGDYLALRRIRRKTNMSDHAA